MGLPALQSSHTGLFPHIVLGQWSFPNFKKDHVLMLNFYSAIFNDFPASSFPACLQACATTTSQMLFSNGGKQWVFPSEHRFLWYVFPSNNAQRCASTSRKCLYGNYSARHFEDVTSLWGYFTEQEISTELSSLSRCFVRTESGPTSPIRTFYQGTVLLKPGWMVVKSNAIKALVVLALKFISCVLVNRKYITFTCFKVNE